jgi:predicted ATPase
MPDVLLIDEPELGLHPHALEILAGLLQTASTASQVIVSTQSASLMSQFDAEDIVVVDRKSGESAFRRLDEAELKNWLDDYTLGDLWQKNYIEGASNG